jgi:hypothetical protein
MPIHFDFDIEYFSLLKILRKYLTGILSGNSCSIKQMVSQRTLG